MRVETSRSALTANVEPGTVLQIPINHFEGNYVCDAETLQRLRDEDRIVFRYVRNPNGSLDDIAGVASEHGNVVGLMPHPERASDALLGSADGVVLLESLLASARDLGGVGLIMRAWVRALWWRPPLTEGLLAGRLFGCSPHDAARIVALARGRRRRRHAGDGRVRGRARR